jgi:hypothetical protein
MATTIDQLKKVSQLYKDLAFITDEMIAYEESDENDPEKEALLAGKLIMKMMELERLAK